MSYVQDRIDRLRDLMSNEDIDVFYIRDLSNIKWATAFEGVFDDEDAHALIVTDQDAILHTDSRYGQAAAEAAQDTNITVDTSLKKHAEFLGAFLGEKPEKDSCCSAPSRSAKNGHHRKIGIETSITLGEYRSLEQVFTQSFFQDELYETKGAVLGLRSVKDREEIKKMKAAQAITDAAFCHIAAFIQPGMTERSIQIELEDYMFKHGATGLAFSSIVATGANGANPHAIPGDTILEAGQAVVLDFGARAFGYCSDMTRMIFLGEPNATMCKAYETLRKANEAVESFLRAGVTGAQAQDLAESILEEAGFGGTMGHSLGHGVGIDVHEEPVLAKRNDQPLEVGNVVTVEPGIYIAGEFGMRLEDFGVITERGFEVFTQTDHDMVII